MKRLWMILVAGLLVAALTAPALAWEFALTGEFEWRYRYFARQGNGDLFGSTSLNAATLLPDQEALGLAGPVSALNAVNAVLVQGFSAKGADAQTNETRIWFYPEIRINPAVRIRGEYWLTGTNLRGEYDIGGGGAANSNWVLNPGYNGWYFNAAMTPGNVTTPVGQSIGVWEKCWVTAQSPWGIIAFGRRPFAFGLGWSTLHEKDADTESIIIVAPYGPMTFIIGPSTVYGNQGDNFIENSAVLQAGGNIIQAGGTDKNRMKTWHMAGAFTYRNGPVDTGIFFTYLKHANQHFLPAATTTAGPALRDDFNQGAVQGAFLGTATQLNNGAFPMFGDIDFVLFVNYFKYTNGRFFFNAEYDFEYGDVRKNGGRPTPVWADAWMVELGALCGPSKVSLASFYSSGDDRRGGLFNVTNATGTAVNAAPQIPAGVAVYDRWSRFLVFGGRIEAIKPYVWLMGIYGAGNNSFDLRGYCTYNDWLSYSARLDYAVAANLNVWGSYIWATRASNTGTRIAQFAGGNLIPGRGASPAGIQIPNVPDNYLGWEANVGVDWKLLEGLTFKGQVAYWQPGDWFKWAYVDTGTLGFTTIQTPTGARNLPVSPSRGIDPLVGFQGSLLVEF